MNTPQTATPATHRKALIGSLAFLSSAALLGIWIMQHSVNAYYLQTYHENSPLAEIESPLWRAGGDIGNSLYQWRDQISAGIAAFNQNAADTFNQEYAYTAEYRAALEEQKRQEELRLAEEAERRKQQNALSLNSSQKVLFAGDSMMQGIAPHMQKYLQDRGIQSINLSKQSTGLAYPKFFNWPATIKEAIAKDSSIKVLIVMLGPNDPWDMPSANGSHLRFGTPEWNSEYQSRMADIIGTALNAGLGVIWVTPPNMRKDKLNRQMVELNAVMQEELAKHSLTAIDSRPIMGGGGNLYNDYLKKDGKQIKMRSGDGIHFTVEGQKILAAEVQKHLVLE